MFFAFTYDNNFTVYFMEDKQLFGFNDFDIYINKRSILSELAN